MKFIKILLLSAGLLTANFSYGAGTTKVKISTNFGDIIVALNAKKAPKTVKNFLNYVKQGHYKNTIFHRVIKNFMIQGGGYTIEFKDKSGKVTVINEADNGLKNDRGTIAMARTNDPHSASAQFFINTKDNNFLNYTAKTPRGWGYAVFGKVINGMKVVDKIEAVKTGAKAIFRSDVPLKTVIIHNISIIK